MTSKRAKNWFKIMMRRARLAVGISQGELARRTRLQASAISHFETGQRKPSIDNLVRIAKALDVSTDYLLGRAPWEAKL